MAPHKYETVADVVRGMIADGTLNAGREGAAAAGPIFLVERVGNSGVDYAHGAAQVEYLDRAAVGVQERH